MSKDVVLHQYLIIDVLFDMNDEKDGRKIQALLMMAEIVYDMRQSHREMKGFL